MLKFIIFSSSSRSQNTASTSNSSGPPPAYDTLNSRSSGVISDRSSGKSQFVIRDKNLQSAVASCLIQRERLEIGELIKEGNFGAVYRGNFNNHGRMVSVAVKTLKSIDDSQSFEEFMREGVLMKGNLIP